MHPTVVAALACPHDDTPLHLTGRVLGCPEGHRFDLAKQGYASLIRRPLAHTGDPHTLVERRSRVHHAGLFDPLHEAVAAGARTALAGDTAVPDGIVCDVGAGPGTYLAAVLDALPRRCGLAIDASRAAARRAARCHARAGAVVADVWDRLPVRTGGVALLLDVFAPRAPEEFARVVAPGGSLLVVTPLPEHLAELRAAFDLLAVDDHKADHVSTQLGDTFEGSARETVVTTVELTRQQAVDLAGMGASGHHLHAAALEAHAGRLPERSSVQIAVTLSWFVRTEAPPPLPAETVDATR